MLSDLAQTVFFISNIIAFGAQKPPQRNRNRMGLGIRQEAFHVLIFFLLPRVSFNLIQKVSADIVCYPFPAGWAWLLIALGSLALLLALAGGGFYAWLWWRNSRVEPMEPNRNRYAPHKFLPDGYLINSPISYRL